MAHPASPATAARRSFLVSPTERVYGMVGNTYFESFITTGSMTRGFAILTDQRVYFKGSCYVRNGKNFLHRTEDRIVDIRDVTGSGFVQTNPIGLLITAIIFILSTVIFGLAAIGATEDEAVLFPILCEVSSIIAIVFYALYSSRKKYVFEVDFAGGAIAFDVRLYPKTDAEDFQKKLRMLKDRIKEAEKSSVSRSPADCTEQLNTLIQQLNAGYITREEYELLKRRLLGS